MGTFDDIIYPEPKQYPYQVSSEASPGVGKLRDEDTLISATNLCTKCQCQGHIGDIVTKPCSTFESSVPIHHFLDECNQPLLWNFTGNTHNAVLSGSDTPDSHESPNLFDPKSGTDTNEKRLTGTWELEKEDNIVYLRCCEVGLGKIKSVLSRADVWKVMLALAYLAVVMLLTSNILVLVYMRAPTNKTWPNVAYRHLPDIFLDIVERQDWAFKTAEIIIQFSTFSVVTLIIFHQNTLVVMRRLLCHYASIFFIRTFCVLSTSLLYTGEHHVHFCPPINITTPRQYIGKAFRIMFGAGLRIQGGNTCNDFIFSGHTSTLVLCTLFIINYGPWSCYFIPLHILSVVSALVGTACVVMGHEHYTVDVVLAIIITVLYFNHYHGIANSRELRERDYWRIVLTSPITYFMEKNGEDKVENKFRVPFCHEHLVKKWREYRPKGT